MSTRIGLTFGDELLAAGLAGLPFAWGADGTFEFSSRMTAEQRAAVLEVYAVHDPTKTRPQPVDRVAQLEQRVAALEATRGVR